MMRLQNFHTVAREQLHGAILYNGNGTSLEPPQRLPELQIAGIEFDKISKNVQ